MSQIDELPLRSVLLNEDDLGKVVRIHIHIEALINTYISKAVRAPEHLNKLNLDYSGRVNLALCLGFSVDLQKPLNAIGKMRNDFAHKLEQKIDENRIDNFFNTFSSIQKAELIETIKYTSWGRWGKGSSEEKFTALCIALYYMCKMEISKLELDIKSTSQNKLFTEHHLKVNL